jgi:hypothetical protein
MTDATAPARKPGFDQALIDRTTFEKTAIWLPAYGVQHLNAGIPVIDGKTFIDCLFEGPGVLMATDNVTFEGCNLGVSSDPKNLMVQAVGSRMVGAIPFSNTRFIGCRFLAVAFTGHPDFMTQMIEVLQVQRDAEDGAA